MAAPKEARVPDIGGYDDVPVIEVLVAVGDSVEQDQGLVTLESDKATMEVPAPFAGVVRELKAKVGDRLAEGSVVALIEAAEDDAPTDPTAGSKSEASRSSSVDTGKSPDSKGTEPDPAVEPVAVADTPDKIAQRSIEADRGKEPTPADAPQAGGEQRATPLPRSADAVRTPPVAFDAAGLLPGKAPYASPAVRLFARELGVDLARVSGSGRGGRIVREDVQGFVKGALQGSPAAAVGGGGLQLLPWPKIDFAKFGEVETQPLSRIKKIGGANLARNWAMIPHVTQHDAADITELEELRVELNTEHAEAKDGIKLTMLGFLIKASVAALQKYPEFNASLDASGETLTLKKYFHIGFAADTPNGLVVPVVRDCDEKGVIEIAQETAALAKKARESGLSPAEMSGGCFTISSLGGIGGTAFTPIVNAPEVAILGVSKASMQPVWDGEAFLPRLMLPLSLSYDHRVIDGAAAARFTAYIAQLLADLRRGLL